MTALSESSEWETPGHVIELVTSLFGPITLDVASTDRNAVCAEHCTEGALERTWRSAGITWCNPPYGRDIHLWIDRAIEEAQRGAHIVMLVPAHTDTAWFHRAAACARVYFLRGRLQFTLAGVSMGSARFPSALIEFTSAQDTGMGVIDARPTRKGVAT